MNKLGMIWEANGRNLIEVRLPGGTEEHNGKHRPEYPATQHLHEYKFTSLQEFLLHSAHTQRTRVFRVTLRTNGSPQ
jgi:hypothetical protein